MGRASDLILKLEHAGVNAGEVDWEAVLRINYCALPDDGAKIFDVGGNLGAHAVCFVEDVKASGLAIFEPLPDMFAILKDRFQCNTKVQLYNLALSDQVGNAKFQWKRNAPAESGLQAKSIYSDGDVSNLVELDVEVRTVDGLRLDIGFDPDFIKIDIEGAEIHMLRGAEQTVSSARPLISVEYGFVGYEAFGHTADALVVWAEKNNYAIADLFGNVFEPGEFLSCVNRFYWDYMLLPRERVADLDERLRIIQRLTLPVPMSKWRDTNMDIINRL